MDETLWMGSVGGVQHAVPGSKDLRSMPVMDHRHAHRATGRGGADVRGKFFNDPIEG